MSDYLATLAARVRPIAPPIEPRKASMFESPSIEPTSAPPTASENGSRTPGELLRNDATVPEPATPPRQTAPGPVVTTAAAQNSAATPILIAPIVSTPSVPPFAGVIPEKIITEKTFSVPPSLVVAASPLVAPTPQPSPSQPATIHTILTEKIIPAATAESAAPSAKPPVTPPPPAPAFAPPAVRLIEPASRAPDSNHSASPARTGPPAIRVTIGRVEVRAVLPSAPPQPPAPLAKKTNPVISLDDYLKLQSSRSSRS